MSDKLNSLNLSFDRVLIQLIIPGMIATFPFCIIIHRNLPKEIKDLFVNDSINFTAILIVSLVAGMILENFGSLIEVKIFDKLNAKNNSTYIETWEKYLMLKFDGGEPIGARYIRNVLLRMKFELSFGLSLIPFDIGLFILNTKFQFVGGVCVQVLCFIIIPTISICQLLIFEARSSSSILANTRKLLVDKYFKDNIHQ